MRDESVSDETWWFSPHAEFEDFVGLGEERVKNLVKEIRDKVSPYVINRLLHANEMPHGPRNTMEGPCSTCGTIPEELRSDVERGKLMLLEITDHLDNTDGIHMGGLQPQFDRVDVKSIRYWVKKLRTLLDNMGEKTCTLTWREDGTALADCSNCGEEQLYSDYKYCPDCGAKNINPEGETPNTSDDHPDDEVNIPPEAAQIGMMHPIDEVYEPPPPDGEDFDWSKVPIMQKVTPVDEPKQRCICYNGSLLGPGWPNCPYCGGKLPSGFIPEGVVYGDTDSMLMLFCKECNKIIRDPVWDEETHSPYCPVCKTTIVEKSPDEEDGSK